MPLESKNIHFWYVCRILRKTNLVFSNQKQTRKKPSNLKGTDIYKQNENRLIDTEYKLVIARLGGGAFVGPIGCV